MEEHKHMQVNHNFLLNQYKETGVYPINHNYLFEQFSDYKDIFRKIENLITNSDYTLGKSVYEFEKNICALTGSRFAVGVGSGTDALFLSLIASGIQKGDEVITTPYTFYSTIGAIVTAGANPVFVDICDDYNITQFAGATKAWNEYFIDKKMVTFTHSELCDNSIDLVFKSIVELRYMNGNFKIKKLLLYLKL